MEVLLTWWNDAYGFLLVFISNLKLSSKLLVSSIRCVTQLTIMAIILRPIFLEKNPVYVFLVSGVMTLSGSIEVALLKSKFTYPGIFWVCLTSLIITNFCLAILGTGCIMGVQPFYDAQHFIPTFGMLVGNSTSAVAISLSLLMKQLISEKEKIEMSLAFGATRWEAAYPYIVEAIKIGMLPTLNAMSVQGLVTIPGTDMTGQILGGVDPLDAVKYQHVIMFLIGSSTTLCSVFCCFATYYILFDKQTHRLNYHKLQKQTSFSLSTITKKSN
ncbi:UPF0014-domain-containing protein [Rozella allomycis CSF55]|uniref:Putative CHP00245 domain-containing protein n=1 Tax=Rozella allomycis (strain CSF55) TaxID=988480 RepID=A0A075AQ93_ROZAC|nr:putative CHP00245 domain-containing protein [Rozella allomycis CSF55]RKP18923.1 UPF0014-domain-containing protein [Rozella allomycis CSF55]|eukprot:EPZ32416.1 putative CHP00245 domain-containing protein [Rozella allomycis CSF55]